MGFTFHNSYTILVLVPNTLMLWAPLSCWYRHHCNKATLLLCWTRRYKNWMVVITIWLIVTKYQFIKWQWIFFFKCRFFSFLYQLQDFYGTWVPRWVWISSSLTFARTWVHTQFVRGPCCTSFQFCCVVFFALCAVCVLSPPLPVFLRIANYWWLLRFSLTFILQTTTICNDKPNNGPQ